jgi:hypothetical protein
MSYPQASVGALTTVDTAVTNPLGTRRRDDAGNEYIYLQGVASTAAGDVVTYDEAFLTARSVASAVGPVAVALAAVLASQFGWYVIDGSATVNTSAAVADNAKLFLTATAGSVDDTSVAGDQIVGMIARSAAGGAATITAQLFGGARVGVNVA